MLKKEKYRILIGAGGTGGHVFPAIALAKKFQDDGHRVIIVGTGNELERKIFNKQEIETIFFDSTFTQSKQKSLFGKIKAFLPFAMSKKELEEDERLKNFVVEINPHLILGMGGYASIDLMKKSRYCYELVSNGPFMPEDVIEPYLAIHEQNAKSGRANRYIAMFLARGVIEGLPGAFDWKTKLFKLSSDDHVFMGNPIRDEIINIYKEVRPFSEFSKNPRILVFGGSQGARKINQTIPKMLEKIDKEMNIEIIHQTGELDYQDVLASYEKRGLSANIMPFINDMAGAYEWADLVIGRSGAMTVSELSAIGMPSILIPYPHAMDNHQWFNAKFIADKSGAELILDKDLEPEMLAICIEKIFSDKDILVKMSKATFDQAFVDATKNITQFCYKMIQQPPLKNLKDFSM